MKFSHLFIHPSDFDVSRSFYMDNLKLQEIASWGDENSPRGSVLKLGEFSVTIAERHEDDTDNAWTHGVAGRQPTVHVDVGSLDDAFEAVRGGAQVKIVPENTHWGTKWFVIEDPDGNLIAVNQPADS